MVAPEDGIWGNGPGILGGVVREGYSEEVTFE